MLKNCLGLIGEEVIVEEGVVAEDLGTPVGAEAAAGRLEVWPFNSRATMSQAAREIVVGSA